MKARAVNPVAIHENASIFVPTSALTFRSVCDVKAYLKIRDIAVPRAEAMRTSSVASKAKKLTGRLHHRDFRTIGETKIMTKLRTRPDIKKPNIIFEAMRRMFKMSFTSEGRAIEAPAKSSFRRISTGLNQ